MSVLSTQIKPNYMSFSGLPFDEWAFFNNGHGWSKLDNRYKCVIMYKGHKIFCIPKKYKNFVDKLVGKKYWNDCRIQVVEVTDSELINTLKENSENL